MSFHTFFFKGCSVYHRCFTIILQYIKHRKKIVHQKFLLKKYLNRELHMYPRRYTVVLTFHRHNCAVAFSFLNVKPIYYSLASRNWTTSSTEVSEHSMSTFVSLTLSAEQGEKHILRSCMDYIAVCIYFREIFMTQNICLCLECLCS